MSREHFSKYRSLMHTYSRALTMEGQEFYDQMSVKSGHRINIDEIRAENYPAIKSIEDRDEYFLTTNNEGVRVVGGSAGANFTKVIAFLDKIELKEINNTNKESYRVIDSFGIPIQEFIDPADRLWDNVNLSIGYDVRLFDSTGKTIIPRNFGWDFDYFNGIVHFDSKFKPGSPAWEEQNFGIPRLEGFIYIGKKADDTLNKICKNTDALYDELTDYAENSIAIQPFKFSSDKMYKVDDPYKADINHLDGEQEYLQQLTFIVPGYVFELTSLDIDQTFITELRHLRNGDTQIFIDLPWNIQYDRPIRNYKWSTGLEGLGVKIPQIGSYHFMATSFVQKNGKKITIKDTIDYEDPRNEIIEPSEEYEYVMKNIEDEFEVPFDEMNNHHCGYNNGEINVNINN